MKKRMWALVLVGVLAFGQTDAVVFAQDTALQSDEGIMTGTNGIVVTPTEKKISADGGQAIFNAAGGSLANYKLVDSTGKEVVSGEDYQELMLAPDGATLVLNILQNKGSEERRWTLQVEGEALATIIQAGKSAVESVLTDVKEISKKVLPDGRTEVVYTVSGSNLEEVGIKVKEWFTIIPTSVYEIEREGTGDSQNVKLTFPRNEDTWEWEYTVHFYPTINTAGDGAQMNNITIDPAGAAIQTAITSVAPLKTEAEWNETEVEFTVTGTGLTSDNLEVNVTDEAGNAVNAAIGAMNGNDTEQKFTVKFPENPDTMNKKYMVSAKVKGETEEKTSEVTIKGKAWDIEQTIQDVQVSKTELSNDDRTVTFTLTGENLSSNTFVKVLKDMLAVDTTPLNVSIEGSGTSQTVTMELPENTSIDKDVEYTIKFIADGEYGIYSKSVTVKVLKAESESASIISFSADKNSMESAGGTVKFNLLGINLNKKVAVKVLKDGVENKELTPLFVNETQAAQTFTLNFPENQTDKAVVYTVKVAADANADDSEWKEATITLAGKIQTEAVVTAISTDQKNVSKKGGKVILTVSGAGLTADNWTANVRTYIAGTNIEMPAPKAEISEISANGAVLTIPQNTMKNQMEYRVTAGVTKNNAMQEQAETSVFQESKGETTPVELQEVALLDKYTVVATFKHDVEAASADSEELKSKFKLSGYKYAADTEEGKLGPNDTVKVEGSQVTINLTAEYNGTDASRLEIAEGALKKDGIIGEATYGYLVTKPSVSLIEYTKDVFEYTGGTAVATLKGTRLNEVKKESINAKVLNPSTMEDTKIPIEIIEGEEPVIRFDIPENTTDKTQCYLLSLEIDGRPVYESGGVNQARRAIVSVLPKGTDANTQTLGALTISGNNKVEDDGLSDIEVMVSKAVGELKVVLKLSGTNLDSTKTAVRAIDENGVVWPIYHIAECDGTFRFVSVTGPNANGVVGDGNSQFIEVLPPRYAGTNKTYKIQVALDGVNFMEEPAVTLKVNNEGIRGEEGFTECGKENILQIQAKYIDEETGKEIAAADVYEGYSISMWNQFDIKAKQIEGYESVSGDDFSEYVGYFYAEKPKDTFTFKYRRAGGEETPTPENPEEPDNSNSGVTPENPTVPEENGSSAGNNQTGTNQTVRNNKSPKTGDTAPVVPFAAASVVSLVGIGIILKKRTK